MLAIRNPLLGKAWATQHHDCSGQKVEIGNCMDTPLHPRGELDVRGLTRSEVESLVLEAYRCGNLSDEQVRRFLGLKTQFDVDAFLKEHGVYVNYNWEDLEQDLKFSDSWLSSQRPRR